MDEKQALKYIMGEELTEQDKKDILFFRLRGEIKKSNLSPQEFALLLRESLEPEFLGEVLRILLIYQQP